jgi:outer membrane protein assembly factor BamE
MSEFPRYLMSRCVRLSLLLVAALGLTACGSFQTTSNSIASVVRPYKMDVVQGNFVSKEQAAALTTGMSRDQVRSVLGTPLLTSVFHADRWDYVFTFRRQGLEPQARKLTVYFKDGGMERFESDELPTEAEFVATLDSGRKIGPVPSLEATEAQLSKFPAVPAAAVPTAALPPLPASYPPLEPAGR